VRVKKRSFSPGSFAGAYDSHAIIILVTPDNHDETPWDKSNGEKAFFEVRMFVIKNLKVIQALREQDARLTKGDSMLQQVARGLILVPLESHEISVLNR